MKQECVLKSEIATMAKKRKASNFLISQLLFQKTIDLNSIVYYKVSFSSELDYLFFTIY